MESVLPLKVLGCLPSTRRPAGLGSGCSCPGVPAGDAWEEVVAAVEGELETMRRREMSRRRGGLDGLSEEQRMTVERLTQELLRRAVLEGLHRLVGKRRRMSAGALQDIRAMFATGR